MKKDISIKLPDPYKDRKTSGSFVRWANKLRASLKLAEWSEDESVGVLVTLVEGEAEDHYYKLLTFNGVENWNLDKWLEALGKKFPEPQPLEKEYSFYGLIKLRPRVGERLSEFIGRFEDYCTCLGIGEALEKVAKDALVEATRETYPQEFREVLMRDEFGDYTARQLGQALIKVEEKLNMVKIGNSRDETVPLEDSLELLTREVANLKLMVAKRGHPVNMERRVCFNCGELGHGARECAAPRDPLGFKNRFEEFQRGKATRPRQGSAGVEESKKKAMVVLAAQHKRVRVDDLLTDEEEQPMSSRQAVVSDKGEKKNGQSKISKASQVLTDKVLDSSVPMTVRELLKIRPAIIKTLAGQLDDAKRGVALAVDGEALNSERFDATSYVLVKVGDNEVSLFVDIGASCCIVTKKFLKSMGIPFKSKQSGVLLPAAGEVMRIVGEVILEVGFAEGILVKLTFAVVEECVVPLLLGLDACKALKSKIDYEYDTLEFEWEARNVALPLCTKREAQEVIRKSRLRSEEEDGEEELVLFVQEKEIMGVGSDDYEDLILLAKNKMKKSYTLPPMEPFTIQRRLPEEDAFEEDLLYFDLPGGVSEDFGSRVDAKLEGISFLEDGTKLALRKLLVKYKSIFPEYHIGMPGIKGFEYRIEVDPKVPPISKKMRPYSEKEKETMKEHVEALLESGIISPCQSPWGFTSVFAPKPDGSLRYCVNFKALNDVTIKDKYPVPLIGDMLKFMRGREVYSVMDCFAGYWQVKLDEISRQYCVVRTPFGTFCFNVLPMGLSNAVSYFQSMMEKIFSKFLWDFLVVYLDDLAVVSSSEKEHLIHLEKVFKLCLKWGVCLKLKKCQFFVKEFTYLGFVVNKSGIQPDERKVQALAIRPAPTNVRELRSFLGVGNYFRRFIPHYADLVSPMGALLKKNARWEWSEACVGAFVKVKEILLELPKLYHVEPGADLILSTDASNVAIGAVLEMMMESGLVPISYYSRKFVAAERNYMTYEQEGLALVEAVKHYREYLVGRKFIVYTDNSAIATLFKEKEPSGRMIRWIHVLTEFDCEIRHRDGKFNPVADYLSRPGLGLAMKLERNYALRELTEDQIFGYLSSGKVPPGFNNDKAFRTVMSKFVVVENQLYRRKKEGNLLVVSGLKQLHEILGILHDQLGHFSVDTIWTWVRERYWRKNLYREVENYVRSCLSCQEFRTKRPLYKFDGKSGISGIFGEWGIDFLGPFPVSEEGNSYVCCMVNILTGFPYCEATRDCTSKSAIKVTERMFSLFGVPGKIRCDQGPAFRAAAYQKLCQNYGAKIEFLPAYTPEWAGFVEKLAGVIRYCLAKSCGQNYSNWCSYLPQILLGIRARVTKRTGVTPFYLMFGVRPKLPLDGKFIGEWKGNTELREVEIERLPGLRATFERESSSSSTNVTFQVGDLVMVLDSTLRKRGVIDKKKVRYTGPFQVVEVCEQRLYVCKNADGQLFSFHVSRLVGFVPRWFNSSQGRVVGRDYDLTRES